MYIFTTSINTLGNKVISGSTMIATVKYFIHAEMHAGFLYWQNVFWIKFQGTQNTENVVLSMLIFFCR